MTTGGSGTATLLTITLLVVVGSQLGPAAFLKLAPLGLVSLWMCGHCDTASAVPTELPC
eukprot:COSAG02_NODE_66040_length_256_cov_0.987261_1_plen_58_part_01